MALRHPPPFALPPEQPAHVYTLEALLQGCLVASHALTAPLTLLGRDADACAIALTDASASRVHCALAYHGTTQQLYACDQGSANGEFLIGELYENGLGVLQDVCAATLWYSRSAKQGDEVARRSLLGLAAKGVPDAAAAVRRLRLAP